MAIERLTNQKRAILDYLRKVSGHPDAYEVYAIIKKKLPQISLATIYRNLDNMVKNGLIKEIRIKEDRFNYDGDERHHHHFKCLNCEMIFNVGGDIILNYEKINEITPVGLIEEYDVMLRGICLNCQKKK